MNHVTYKPINKNKRIKVYKQIIKKNGGDFQQLIAIEEMSELTKALIKRMRKKIEHIYDAEDIIEEIGDVKVMIEQLDLLYGCATRSNISREMKVRKLAVEHGLSIP